MFPNIEEEVVRTVLESNSGNKDHTINALLALSEGTWWSGIWEQKIILLSIA